MDNNKPNLIKKLKRYKPEDEKLFPAISKKQFEEIYGCYWKTIDAKLKKKGIIIPSDERLLFPDTVKLIFEALGIPVGYELFLETYLKGSSRRR